MFDFVNFVFRLVSRFIGVSVKETEGERFMEESVTVQVHTEDAEAPMATAKELYKWLHREQRLALKRQDWARACNCGKVLEFRGLKYMRFYAIMYLTEQ